MSDLRVLVAEPLAEEGISWLKEHAEVDILLNLDRAGLLETIGEYDAVIVRSGTKLDAEVFERASRLKVIGRAGVGVDNVDLDAATRRGITVVNAPQSNVLSMAEHTIALMLTLARNIPAAHESLRSGAWERSRFTGVELHGKVLGLLGLGRTGTLVAQRASSFGMKLIARDPYVSANRFAQLGIETVSFEELLERSDFLAVHVVKTPETTGMIGDREFAQMKPGIRIVNAARGGIVDEDALHRALLDGRVGGAALDVYEKEPPGKHPLFDLPNVVVTPHLGGETHEAQAKAGVSVAEQVLLALRGEFAPYAVNVQAGTEFVEALRPFIPLADKLGRVLGGLGGAGTSTIEFRVFGTIAEHDTRILVLAALRGLFQGIVTEPVTYVNAPLLAKERGIEVLETKSAQSPDFVDLLVVRAETEEGEISVGGTLVGKRDEERIVKVYDYEIDMFPARHMCFLRYSDRPGIIGKVGTVLGEAGINIAGMHVSRETIGGEALMGLTVDSPIPSETLGRIVKAIEARDAKFIDLEP